MIIQALKEYYDRKADDLPSIGWLDRGIDYLITLTPEGRFQQVECLQEWERKKANPFPSVVPAIGKQALKHTNSGIDANLLWDNSAFVFGIGNKGAIKRKSFVNAIRLWHAGFNDVGVKAVICFYDSVDADSRILDPILNHPDYGDDLRSGSPIVTFRLLGDKDQFIYEHRSVKDAVARNWARLTKDSGTGVCLVSGLQESIETCHAVTKGVWGGQTSGSTIVGFNEPAFRSFNKKQGQNAPVGKTAAFAYTTALNHLLRKGSSQRMQVGDASTVFWAEKKSDLETQFVDIFGEPVKDDPDRGVKAVKSLYKALETGAYSVDTSSNRFYVLGLAPNASRIAIRFWIVNTVERMAHKIVQHFEDLRIVHGPRDKDVLSLFRLLVSTAVQGKSENIPPNLAGETMRAILDGLPYPETLLQGVIRRIRAEHEITYPRAALIKACINRSRRFKNPLGEEELKVSLDLSNINIGYRLGRLFAALEKIQSEANPGINATIRDRFYGAASGTPVAVFSNLMRLKNHHLVKMENRGRRIFFERLIAEIMESVQDFPSHLSLADQGRFAIGYYHQNQQFYTKKDVESNIAQTINEGDTSHE